MSLATRTNNVSGVTHIVKRITPAFGNKAFWWPLCGMHGPDLNPVEAGNMRHTGCKRCQKIYGAASDKLKTLCELEDTK